MQIVELRVAEATNATVLCAKLGLKTPDALQAASALGLDEPTVFVTGDTGFQRVPTLNLRLVAAS